MLAATAAHKVGDPLAFYAVAATIIPVLLLGLVYQSQTLELFSEGSPLWRVINGFYFIFMALLGESASLHVLSTQHPTAVAHRFTTASLVLLGMFLPSATVLDALLDPTATRDARIRVYMATAGGYVGVVVVLLWTVETF